MFVDTGAWLALVVARDQRHAAARDFLRSLPSSSRLTTSNYVLSEAYSWLARRGYQRGAIGLRGMVDASERDGRTAVVWIDRKLEDDGWRVFLQFDDQNFSFCDCTSIAICRNLGIDTVFGFDADFAIAGLELRPSA